MTFRQRFKHHCHGVCARVHIAKQAFAAEVGCASGVSLSKKAWPGVWTNSVCGHPQQGESTEAAIIRRSRFELGVEITNLTPVYPDFRYRATDPNGIVENEVCPVYAAQVTSALQVNPDEVMDYQWSGLETVLQALSAAPWAFSPWMVLQASDDKARELLREYNQG